MYSIGIIVSTFSILFSTILFRITGLLYDSNKCSSRSSITVYCYGVLFFFTLFCQTVILLLLFCFRCFLLWFGLLLYCCSGFSFFFFEIATTTT